MTTQQNISTLPALRDTQCDNCGCELPKGSDLTISDESTAAYCSVTCWEEATDDQEKESDNTVVDK
jgi:RNase P subunit RPR2